MGRGRARRTSAGSRKKFQFGVSPEVEKLLESLRLDTGADSWSEVIRDAVRAYAWITTAHKEGYDVIRTERNVNMFNLAQATELVKRFTPQSTPDK